MAKYSKKAKEEKNKYGMIALTFNRSKKISHIVPNIFIYLAGDAALKQDREVFSGVVRFK